MLADTDIRLNFTSNKTNRFKISEFVEKLQHFKNGYASCWVILYMPMHFTHASIFMHADKINHTAVKRHFRKRKHNAYDSLFAVLYFNSLCKSTLF